MAVYDLSYYNWTTITLKEAGSTDFAPATHNVRFNQDAEVVAVMVEKPSNGTLTVKIEPDLQEGGVSIPLGNLSMIAADTSKMFTDSTPLPTGGRLTLTSSGVTGDKIVTIIARADTKLRR